MSFTDRMIESEARSLERRADLLKNPAKAAELREKAAAARRRAAPPAPSAPLDPPTVQLRPVKPGTPAPPPAGGPGLTLRQKVIGGTMAAVLLAAGWGWLTGPDDPAVTTTPAATAAYSVADREACRDGASALRAVGAGTRDLDTAAGRETAQADTLVVAEQMQGAALAADNPRVAGALGDGADLIRRAGALLDSGEGAAQVEEDTDPVFAEITDACGPVLAGAQTGT